MFHSNSEKDYEKSFWAVENFWMPSRAALDLGRHLGGLSRRVFFDWKLSAFVDTSAITYYINTNPELEITKKIPAENFCKTFFFSWKKIRQKTFYILRYREENEVTSDTTHTGMYSYCNFSTLTSL